MAWAGFYGGVVTAATTLLTVLAAAAVLLPRGRQRDLLARASLTSSLAGLAVAALVALAQLAPQAAYRVSVSVVVALLGVVTILVEVGIAARVAADRADPVRLTRAQRWWLLAGVPTAAAYVVIAAGAADPALVSIPVTYLLVSGAVESLFASPSPAEAR